MAFPTTVRINVRFMLLVPAVQEAPHAISRFQADGEHVLSSPQRYRSIICHGCWVEGGGGDKNLPGNMALISIIV
jgi:hypothetical protein